MSVEYHQAALSLEKSHELCYTQIRRDTHKHMDMIHTRFCFYNFYTFLFAQRPQYFSDVFFELSVDFFSPELWCEYDMVLTFPRRM